MTIQQRIGELKKELKVRGVWKLIEGEGKNALESRANYNILVEAKLEGIKFTLEEVGKAIDKVFLKEYGKKWVNELKQKLGLL